METVIVGERGQITIPKSLREKYGISPKQLVIIEDRDGELVIKPAMTVSLKKIKSLIKEYDEEFVKKLMEENKVSPEEEQKILSMWLKKE